MLKNLKLNFSGEQENLFPYSECGIVDRQELEAHLKITSGGTIDGVPTC